MMETAAAGGPDPETLDRVLAAGLRGESEPWPAEWAREDAIPIALGRIAFHGVCAQLLAQDLRFLDWPAEVIEFTRGEARMQALWEATHRPVVAEAVAAMAVAGVASLLLKGTALAYSVWDPPEMRRRGDSDLMVDPADVGAARAVLAALGWRVKEREVFQETWVSGPAAGFEHAIDLHWRMRDLLNEPRSLRFAECFARSVPLERFHPLARACDPATTLVNCSLNHAAHRVYGYRSLGAGNTGEVHLGGVADTDRLVANFEDRDWEALLRLCSESRAARAVLQALQAARTWLHTPVPAVFIVQVERIAVEEARDGGGMLLPTRGGLASSLAKLGAARGWRAKVDVVRRAIWPSRERLGLPADAPQGELFRFRVKRLSERIGFTRRSGHRR